MKLCLSVMLLVVLLGCGGSGSGTPDNADDPGSDGRGGQSGESDSLDRSLRVASWEQRGGPNPARRWTLDDYQTASTLLTEVAREEPWIMPRYDSPKSGPIFARLINTENLATLAGNDVATRTAALRDLAVSIAVTWHEVTVRTTRKLEHGGDIREEEVELIRDHPLDREAVELDGFALDVMIRAMALRIDELQAAGSDPRNISAERRRVVGFITGLIQRFENKKWFSDSSMRRYGDLLATHLPAAFEAFDVATRDELRAIIEVTMPRVHTAVGRDALDKALRSISR